MKIKVYSLLSLGGDRIRSILPGAIARPPIQRNCLRGDVGDGTHIVAIVDGVFQQALAVTPGEIVDAMRAGVRVYGSSSMGALRAAELSGSGMVGHGRIFERVAASDHYRDDYLAQLFTESEGEPRALTLPYADFEFLLDGHVGHSITARDRMLLLRLYSSLFYGDRNRANLSRLLARRGAGRLTRLVDRVFRVRKTQKTIDAESMLRRIRADVARTRASNRRVAAGWRKLCF